MRDPILTLAILVAYVASIVSIKFIMRNKKPFELRFFIFVYNVAQVVVSFYIFYEVKERLHAQT